MQSPNATSEEGGEREKRSKDVSRRRMMSWRKFGRGTVIREEIVINEDVMT